MASSGHKSLLLLLQTASLGLCETLPRFTNSLSILVFWFLISILQSLLWSLPSPIISKPASLGNLFSFSNLTSHSPSFHFLLLASHYFPNQFQLLVFIFEAIHQCLCGFIAPDSSCCLPFCMQSHFQRITTLQSYTLPLPWRALIYSLDLLTQESNWYEAPEPPRWLSGKSSDLYPTF